MTPLLSTGLLHSQSDARLARMVADGHPRAFDVIVGRYRRPLRRYCQRMLSEGLAEDVVQQTFMQAWGGLRDGLEIRDLRPWLYRVAHNAAINTLKRAGYRYEELEESARYGPAAPGPEEHLERRDRMRAVLATVAALPGNQREALLRVAVDGESRADVGRELGLSDGAVGQLLHRARGTLRAATSALTPWPLISWAAGRGTSANPATRVMELTGSSGGASVAGLALKGGAVLVAATAIAGTPVVVHRLAQPASASAAEAPVALTAEGYRAGDPGQRLLGALSGRGSPVSNLLAWNPPPVRRGASRLTLGEALHSSADATAGAAPVASASASPAGGTGAGSPSSGGPEASGASPADAAPAPPDQPPGDPAPGATDPTPVDPGAVDASGTSSSGSDPSAGGSAADGSVSTDASSSASGAPDGSNPAADSGAGAPSDPSASSDPAASPPAGP